MSSNRNRNRRRKARQTAADKLRTVPVLKGRAGSAQPAATGEGSQLATVDAPEVVEWAGRLTPKKLPELLDEIAGLVERIEGSARMRLYKAIEVAAVMSKHFERSRSGWQLFCQRSEWEKAPARGRPEPSDDTEPLPFVMRFIIGVGRNEAKSANRYKLVAEWLLSSGTEPGDIAAALVAHGGVDGVMKLRDNGPLTDDDFVSVDNENDNDDAEGDGDDALANRQGVRKSSAATTRSPTVVSDTRANQAPNFYRVEIDLGKYWTRFASLGPDSEVQVRFRVLDMSADPSTLKMLSMKAL